MTRDELARRVQREFPDLTIAGTKEVVRAVFEMIATLLEAKETIDIYGFGRFATKFVPERERFDPRNRNKIICPAQRKIVFKPFPAFKRVIKSLGT